VIAGINRKQKSLLFGAGFFVFGLLFPGVRCLLPWRSMPPVKRTPLRKASLLSNLKSSEEARLQIMRRSRVVSHFAHQIREERVELRRRWQIDGLVQIVLR